MLSGWRGLQMFHFPFKTTLLTCWLFAGGLYCLAQEAPVTNAVPNASAVAAPTLAPTLAYVPLTQHERFHRYVKSLVSLEALGRSVAGAGLQQWSDTPYEWKHGIDGYAKRFGNSYGEYIIRQSLTYGLSSALGEDKPVYPLGSDGLRSPHRVCGGKYVSGPPVRRHAPVIVFPPECRIGYRIHFTRVAAAVDAGPGACLRQLRNNDGLGDRIQCCARIFARCAAPSSSIAVEIGYQSRKALLRIDVRQTLFFRRWRGYPQQRR